MARPHGTGINGKPVDLIGQPIDVRPSPSPGLIITTTEEVLNMAKVEKRGVYTLNGSRFHINAGDVLPEGAVLDEERSLTAAPENKAAKAAPENRSIKVEKKADA